MGECGCGDMQLDFRFKGPGKDIYALELYPSCRYCEAPVQVVLYRFNPKDAKLWDIEDIPEMKISGIGTQIAIIDLNILKKKVNEVIGEPLFLSRNDWASLLRDVISETIKEDKESR